MLLELYKDVDNSLVVSVSVKSVCRYELQGDDEHFDMKFQREVVVEEERGEETDFEDYNTEEEFGYEKNSDLGTSSLFYDPNPTSTEHVDCTLISEHGNTKLAGTPVHSPKNQSTPTVPVSSSKLGNISPTSPSLSNLCMHLFNPHNRVLMDKGDESVSDPKLTLDSGDEAHNTPRVNGYQSESDAPFNFSTEQVGVKGEGLADLQSLRKDK
ncbi:hypothetical protein LguiA_001947 [Lonicera macranthoides]